MSNQVEESRTNLINDEIGNIDITINPKFKDKIDLTKLTQSINKIIENNDQFQQVPWVDDDRKIPQGLAGNSAYMIKPAGARKLLQLVKEYGAWPNDAIMCRQLLPNIGVTRKFYTKVQGLRSTTTL